MHESLETGTLSPKRADRRAAARKPRETDAVERILTCAELCFQEAGFSGVTLRQVAERAGVSKSLVLYHFDSKDHVYAELQLRIGQRLARCVTEAVAGADDAPADRARVALEALMTSLRGGNDLALHAMLGVRALSHPEVVPHVQRVRRELRELLHRTMEEIFGPDTSQLPITIDAAGDLLWAALTGLSVQALLDDSRAELERGFESVRTLVELAFSTAPAHPRG